MDDYKVITVSIAINHYAPDCWYVEYEYELLNKYLAEGYIIINQLHSVSNAKLAVSENITFILKKQQ